MPAKEAGTGDEERAKAAIDRSRSGSTGSAIMAHFLAAADIRLANAGFPCPPGLILAVSI